jgi:5-aminopentanamidase
LKVAAYQAPLRATRSNGVVDLIREQIAFCESQAVDVLCCPEAVLGGLADYASRPGDIAIDAKAGELQALLAPLVSDKVSIVLGFTEVDCERLYNSAAVFHEGSVVGIYRKLYPAINKSVYTAGNEMPVFTIRGLTFGIIICNDSNFAEPATIMAAQNATALFVPTNNSLPPAKGGPELMALARKADVSRAVENGVWVIRADVAGRTNGFVSYGSSEIVSPKGAVVRQARKLVPDLIMAEF